jgi:hypothetical protein
MLTVLGGLAEFERDLLKQLENRGSSAFGGACCTGENAKEWRINAMRSNRGLPFDDRGAGAQVRPN